jgi:iron complex outermembrane receptor protein
MYYSVTTGYRAGGYSLGILDSRATNDGGEIKPLSYDQEEVMAMEVGYKGTLQDGKLQINASAYYYDYDNYQDRVSVFSPTSGTGLDQVKNAESATNRGLEVEAMWLASDNLTVGGNASYTKTEYTSDFYLLEDDNPAYPSNLFTDTTGDDAFMVKNLNGNALRRIPEWKATVWGSYEWLLANGSLTAGGSWSYTGEYYSSGIQRNLDLVPSRKRIDLSLTWRDTAERWQVRGFVDNVFDETNIREISTPTAGWDWQLRAATLYPRFFGLDVTYKMGG